jgi:hypothetical protein
MFFESVQPFHSAVLMPNCWVIYAGLGRMQKPVGRWIWSWASSKQEAKP